MKFRQAMLGLAALLATASAHALVDPNSHFDNANDFSIAQNPNGVWSYGYSATAGGTFNALTQAASDASGMEGWYTLNPATYATPAVYHNASLDPFGFSTVTVAGLEAGFHPGPDALAIYRFTAPAAGAYSVEALFFTQDASATGVDVYVLKNGGTSLFSAPLAHSNADDFVFWSASVNLSAGATLDFAVGNAGNFMHDATGLGVQIAAVPEPQTYVLLVMGLALVGYAARRRTGRAGLSGG